MVSRRLTITIRDFFNLLNTSDNWARSRRRLPKNQGLSKKVLYFRFEAHKRIYDQILLHNLFIRESISVFPFSFASLKYLQASPNSFIFE